VNIARLAAAILSLSAVIFADAASSPRRRTAAEWAYPITPPNLKPAPDVGVPRRVPEQLRHLPLTQIRDRFIAPVWHPEDHPPLPPVVARQEARRVACGFCHRADGPGGPENSALAGLPRPHRAADKDYKSGARRTAVPKRNIDMMIGLAKAANDEEIAQAAAISLPSSQGRPHGSSDDTVPKTFIMATTTRALPSGEKKPSAKRIIEVPKSSSIRDRDTHAVSSRMCR